MRELKGYEKNLLKKGNDAMFADLLLELHPDICKEAGFTEDDAINYRRSYVEFLPDDPDADTEDGTDGEFVLYAKKHSGRYFFDQMMNLVGVK